MDIVIPTYGRAKNQTTLAQLNEAGIIPWLVVQEREWETGVYEKYELEGKAKIHVLPASITTIAPTRQHIIENVGSRKNIVMLDDDLVFYHRRMDDRTKFEEISPTQLSAALEQMNSLLHSTPHVGFGSREGGNRVTVDYSHNTRIMRVLGYDRNLLMKECITFDRLPVMEDFDVALRLLRLGHPNMVINTVVHNQAGSGKSGGCSHFRTKEVQAEAAYKLQRLHPGFVKVVTKSTKSAWGGGERTDVNIQWKKCYAAGKQS